jgi:hypothetical protein
VTGIDGKAANVVHDRVIESARTLSSCEINPEECSRCRSESARDRSALLEREVPEGQVEDVEVVVAVAALAAASTTRSLSIVARLVPGPITESSVPQVRVPFEGQVPGRTLSTAGALPIS